MLNGHSITMDDVLEGTPSTLDDVFMTPEELAQRWRIDVTSLSNLRSRGDGLPFTKTTGRVLYKVADVLACEARGVRGFSWAKLASAVDSFDGFRSPRDRAAFLEHVRKALKQ